MKHPTDDELEAIAIEIEEHAGWESEWQINITTKATSTIRKLKAERDALREALAEADKLAQAVDEHCNEFAMSVENALTDYRQARAALKEAGT